VMALLFLHSMAGLRRVRIIPSRLTAFTFPRKL